MVSYARATRGLRRPSLDTRSGRPSSPSSREKVGRAPKASLATLLGELRNRGLRENEADTIDLLYVCCTGCLGLLIEFCRDHVNHT